MLTLPKRDISPAPQRDALISEKGSVHKRWIVVHISAQTEH